MAKLPFSRHEAVLLLDGYLESLESDQPKLRIVKRVSDDLRKMAVNSGQEIDSVFRNINGITFQMMSMESAYNGGSVSTGNRLQKPATQLFAEIVDLYRNNRAEYERLLEEARRKVSEKKDGEEDCLTWPVAEEAESASQTSVSPAEKQKKKPQPKRPKAKTAHTKFVRTKKDQKLKNQHPSDFNEVYYSLKRLSEKNSAGVTGTEVFLALDRQIKRKYILEVLNGASWSRTVTSGHFVFYDKEQEKRKKRAMDDALKKAESAFFAWLPSAVPPHALEGVKNSYQTVSSLLVQKRVLPQLLISTNQIGQVETALKQVKSIFGSKKLRNNAAMLLSAYLVYLRETKNTRSAQQQLHDVDVQADWILFDFANASSFERTVPVYCSINGSVITGKRWATILETIVEREIADDNPALEALNKKPLLVGKVTRPFLMKRGIKELNCFELSNGYWINVNLSIPRLMETIQAFCLHCGYSKDQIVLYGAPKGSASAKHVVNQTHQKLKTKPATPPVAATGSGAPTAAAAESSEQHLDDSYYEEKYPEIYAWLVAASKAYDEPDGLSLDRICALIYADDKDAVKDILSHVSWAKVVSENVFSFTRASDVVSTEDQDPDVIEEKAHPYLYRKLKLFAEKQTAPCTLSEIFVGVARAASEEIIQDVLKNLSWVRERRDGRYEFSVRGSAPETSTRGCPVEDHPKPAAAEPTEDFPKERFVDVLMRRFGSGMMFDAIDFDNFREMYEMLFDEKLDYDDAALEARLRHCGFLYRERLFPADAVIDPRTREKVFLYIDDSFAAGKAVLYYKAIMSDLKDELSSCYSLTDEEMLRAYLEYTAEKDKYFFREKYLSRNRHVTIDHYAEVADFLLAAGKPMPVDDVAAALSHIPSEKVKSIIHSDSRFLRNSKGVYFHTDIFEASEEQLKQIAEIIDGFIAEQQYAIWTDVWTRINDKIPDFPADNPYLSSLGVRNALSHRFPGRFCFYGSVISLPGDHFDTTKLYRLYAKSHPVFTMDELYAFSKELDSAVMLFLRTVAEISVRVSHDLFVSRDRITFDADAIDRAIGSFMSKDYICLREIDSFLAFPSVGYAWNEYLLESFVLSFSKRFVLVNNGMAINNVAGAIVKRGGPHTAFSDVCAALLADSGTPLNKDAAMDFLVDKNLITQRRYSGIDSVIQKAAQIRMRKG